MRRPNPAFGERVKQELDTRGLTTRGQRVRTGISHVTVQGMMQGVVPQMETVVAFAQGFGMDVNEWLILAGYEPIEQGETYDSVLGRRMREMRERFQAEGLPFLAGVSDRQTKPNRTAEDAEREAEAIERELRKLLKGE